MSKHIVIAAGGSGGHVLPAVMMGKKLQKKFRVSYVAVGLDQNPYFGEKEAEKFSIEGANFAGGYLSGGAKIAKGTYRAISYLKEQKVDHVIGFGSYHSLPTLLAAIYLKIPFTLFEPNLLPGKVNRYLSKFAKSSMLYFSPPAKFLRGSAKVIDFRLDDEQPSVSQREAREHFGLKPDVLTILVFGGSQGAEAINKAFLSQLSDLTRPVQVLHFGIKPEKLTIEYQQQGIEAVVEPFCSEMPFAWTACDFAICRSGAGAIVEQIIYEKPAILIPYPHAADDHQRENALYMQNEVQGAILLEEKYLQSNQLTAAIDKLSSEGERKKMTGAISAFKEKEKRPSVEEFLQEYL